MQCCTESGHPSQHNTPAHHALPKQLEELDAIVSRVLWWADDVPHCCNAVCNLIRRRER